MNRKQHMSPHRTKWVKISRTAVALACVATMVATSSAWGQELLRPAIAYRTAGGYVTADLDGHPVAFIANDLSERYSIGGEVVAGTVITRGSRDVLGFDAMSGSRLFRIRNAMNPVVLRSGRRVAFLGLGRRDRYANSLWIRSASGAIRRIVRFSVGRGTPGVPTGMEGENAMLDVAFDRAGTRAVIVQGNDLDLFIYDIWVVEIATGEARRLTRGKHSRHATLSPDGTRVVYVNEQIFCGGPAPGYRAGEIAIKAATGGSKRVIAGGDCDVHYSQPRWLDQSTLVARRLTRVEGSDLRDSDLVTIDVATGAVSVVADADAVGLFTVSPSLGRIAYEVFTEATGFYLLDPKTSEEVHFREGRAPRLRGEHRVVY